MPLNNPTQMFERFMSDFTGIIFSSLKVFFSKSFIDDGF